MWCKAEYLASLLQTSVSYQANMLIWHSSNIISSSYYYYYCDVENSLLLHFHVETVILRFFDA